LNNNPLGIVLQSSGTADYNWVTNNILNYNKNGINSGSPYSYFINNTINNCLENGLVNTANNVNIIGNNLVNNNGTGILSIGTYNLIKDNILSNNCVGICLQKSTNGDYNSVTGNSVNNNGNGINSNSPCTELNYNTVYNNVENGIVNTASNVNIKGNTVMNNGGTGILCAGSYINIFNNYLTGNNLGIYLQGFGSGDYNLLTNNTANYNINGINSGSNTTNFYNNTMNYNNQTGLTITGSNCYVVGNSMCHNKEAGLTITGTGNFVITNRLEQNLYDASFSNYNAAVFCFNSVVGNTYQLYSPDTSGTLNAIDNWWGSNSSPVRVYGLFNVNPWIILKLVPSSKTINVGGVSNITADLTYNSAGEDTDLIYTGVFVPDGILVNFSCDSLGFLSSLILNTVNGTATTSFTGNTNGFSTVSAVVNDQNVSTTVNVISVTVLNVNSTSGHKGDIVNLVATFKDGNGQPVPVKTIKFLVNGNVVGTGTTNNNGVTTVSYTITQDPGNYTVIAQFLSDGIYTACNGTCNLLVSPNLVTSNLNLKPVSGYKDDGVNFTATLRDSDGNPLNGKNVVFYINGVSIGSVSTDINGVATLVYILTQSSGSYTTMAMFLQDANYLACNSSSSLQVNLKPTSITTNPVIGYKGDKVNLTATLKDNNNNNLSGKTINFYINGTLVGTGTTNTDGLASYSYTLTQTSGNYIFMAVFEQNGAFETSNSTNYLLVNLIPTQIAINTVTGRNGDNVNLTASLTDTHNSLVLAGRQIIFYINGVKIGSGITNSNGLASFGYIITQNTGTCIITAVYSGDAFYAASNNTGNLQVNLTPTSITTNPVIGYKGDKINLTATLKDNNNNNLSGKTINFYINGTLVGTGTTNTDGTANYQYSLTKPNGIYTIMACYSPSGIHAGSNCTNSLQINLIPTEITVNQITGYTGDNVNLTAVLKENNGLGISGKTVYFSINGVPVGSALTDENGVAVLAINLIDSGGFNLPQSDNDDSYIILANFSADDTYCSSVNSSNLIVKLIPSSIGFESVTGNNGTSLNLVAFLKDNNNRAIFGKTVWFYIGENAVGNATTDINGIATLVYKVSELSKNYCLMVKFLGDDNYNEALTTETLETTPAKTILSILPVSSYGGTKTNLKATLQDNCGSVLSGKLISFFVNNNLIGTAETNLDGIATLVYAINSCGLYNLTAKFSDNVGYNASSDTESWLVNTIPTKIVIKSLKSYRGDKLKLTATLINTFNSTSISGRTVYFYVNGKIVGSGVTNSSGIATYTYLVKEVGGCYTLRSEYKHDNLYTSSCYNTILTVLKISTKSQTNSASCKKNSRVRLTATITNLHTNTKLGNATVRFYVSGRYLGSTTTNKYGVASFYYTTKLNRGTYTITTKYLTNSTYNGSSSLNKLKVS